MTLHQLNEAGEGLADEVLLEWALNVLCSLEDWRWLWSLEAPSTPLLFLTTLLSLLSYNASSVNPWNIYAPNSPNTFAPSAEGIPQDTLNKLA